MKKISKFVLTALLLLLMVGCTEGGEITVDDLEVDNDVVETVEVDATTNEESYLEQIATYDSEIIAIMETVTVATGNIMNLVGMVADKPTIVETNATIFSDAFHSNYDTLETIVEDLKNLEVPKGYENVNALFIKSFENYSASRFDLFNGLLQIDVDKIDKGREIYESGTTVLYEATNEYLALNEKNGYVR